MKAYLSEIILVVAGLGVMAGLLYLVALSESWVRLACILATAVVYIGWYQILLRLARRVLGVDEDDDDQPFFPG
ncbi:MAG: hypothetical protein Q8M54_05150 [Desulfobaccales bacterium]|nr:hypothetical protein [Desulfobaccales bacterium]